MRIKFLGAAGEVTGSCYVVKSGGEELMVDCGMFQGEGADEKNRNGLETDVSRLGAVVLTHAHLDHCGRLPLLVKQGFKGSIFTTPASRDLVEIVLLDAAKVAASNEDVEPIYSQAEVEQVLGMIKTVDYGERVRVGVFDFELLDAGHILGSAMVNMRVKDGESRRQIVFSGDLGNEPSPIVGEIARPENAEIVVMESTYGNREHKERGEEVQLLERVCVEAEEKGGTVLMPAFSLERTQELLHIFDHLKKEGKVKESLPVFLDSPMAMRATAVFLKYPDYFNEQLEKHHSNDDPFDFPGLELVEGMGESKKINGRLGAKVIIAGSGMMSGGRIIFHAARWLPDEKTVLIITGYQAEGTLGREIVDGAKRVVILGREIEIKARVEEITTMSAHADRSQLLEWVEAIKGVKKVVLTHGEEVGRDGLEAGLENKVEVVKPEFNEEVEL